jgi:hypothetical protein
LRAEAIIEAVVNAGGQLTVAGGRIHYRLPKDYPEKESILHGLREHKPEIIRALAVIPPMPEGVRLVSWNPKPAPVALVRIGIVVDVPRFVAMTLLELKAALAGKRWQAGHWTVRELVDRLEQCGIVVALEEAGQQERGQGETR